MLDEEEEIDLNDVNKGGKVDPANTTPSIFGPTPQISGVCEHLKGTVRGLKSAWKGWD